MIKIGLNWSFWLKINPFLSCSSWFWGGLWLGGAGFCFLSCTLDGVFVVLGFDKRVMAKKQSTREWEALVESVNGVSARRFNSLLATMDDEEFTNNYLKILEYVKPKMQRKEIVEENEREKVIRVEYVKADSDSDKKVAPGDIEVKMND